MDYFCLRFHVVTPLTWMIFSFMYTAHSSFWITQQNALLLKDFCFSNPYLLQLFKQNNRTFERIYETEGSV